MTSSEQPKEYIITEFQLKQLQDFASLEFVCQAIKKRPHTPAHPPEAQQRIEQFDEILTDVAIIADESSIVVRDSIKKTERIYHEGSLFAYERMIGYLQKKKEKAIALLQEGRK